MTWRPGQNEMESQEAHHCYSSEKHLQERVQILVGSERKAGKVLFLFLKTEYVCPH